MDRNILRWAVDLAMGIAFAVSFSTGLLKYTLLLQLSGLNSLVLPSALISDLHDRAGVVLGLLVLAHLYLNRRWIVAMTARVIGGKPATDLPE